MTTDTETEPHFAFEQRVRDRLAAATEAAAAAAVAERVAELEVDRLRGDAKLGLVGRGELLVAQRRLAKLQGETADAESAVRATERAVQREREGRQATERAIAQRERASLEVQRTASRARRAELWDRIFSDLEAIDGLPGLPPLSSAGRAYDTSIGALMQLRRLFS